MNGQKICWSSWTVQDIAHGNASDRSMNDRRASVSNGQTLAVAYLDRVIALVGWVNWEIGHIWRNVMRSAWVGVPGLLSSRHSVGGHGSKSLRRMAPLVCVIHAMIAVDREMDQAIADLTHWAFGGEGRTWLSGIPIMRLRGRWVAMSKAMSPPATSTSISSSPVRATVGRWPRGCESSGRISYGCWDLWFFKTKFFTNEESMEFL